MATEVDPRFFVDETSLAVGRALALVRGDVLHPGHRRMPEVPIGADDTVWLTAVATRNLVVISRDRHIRTKPAELDAFHGLSVRAFWIAGKRDLGNWENLSRLVRAWALLEAIIEDRGPGPWFYEINLASIREIPLTRVRAKRPSVRPAGAGSGRGPTQLRLGLPTTDTPANGSSRRSDDA